jgi:hypothetical protein
VSDTPKLTTLSDDDLDRVWTAAIERNDEPFCTLCEVEFRRRTIRGSRTPLVLDLEKRAAERAGKPPSRPTARVDYGNPSQPGEKD